MCLLNFCPLFVELCCARAAAVSDLFPLSDRARSLFAKFEQFIEAENFEQVERRIVADYAERGGKERWAQGIVRLWRMRSSPDIDN